MQLFSTFLKNNPITAQKKLEKHELTIFFAVINFTTIKTKIKSMSVSKLEYIWLDGYKPMQSLRSKTKIENDYDGTLEGTPMWSFDGSSTEQAPGGSSDCLLKPVFVTVDPQRKNAYLVMCEVLNSDGTPHESNGRATIEDDDNDFWFGFEQEYF